MSVRRYELQADRPPSGVTVGTYDTYVEAQRAVDYLSNEKFPVEHTTIVGNNLRKVETVTGRLTTARAVGAGMATGAWFGLFVGLLLGLLAPADGGWIAAVLTGLVLGSMFGAAFGAVSYFQLRGRRDFTSTTAVVATTYDVLCDHAFAEDARNHLARLALKGEVAPLPPDHPSPTISAPSRQEPNE